MAARGGANWSNGCNTSLDTKNSLLLQTEPGFGAADHSRIVGFQPEKGARSRTGVGQGARPPIPNSRVGKEPGKIEQ
jgi:hypothetical protein